MKCVHGQGLKERRLKLIFKTNLLHDSCHIEINRKYKENMHLMI